jgi:S-DNA-T family DNA segregation ATPase FtsK/SpoIIIE
VVLCLDGFSRPNICSLLCNLFREELIEIAAGVREPEKTISALKWAVNEMERRYSLLAEEKVRDIKSYNEKVKNKTVGVEDEDGNIQQVDEGHMPYIVIVIDELADLMMVAARDVEALIVRIAQKARAVGIHLVLATQRPSVDAIYLKYLRRAV